MTAFLDLLFGVGGQLNLGAIAGNGNQVLKFHTFRTQKYGLHSICLTFKKLSQKCILRPMAALQTDSKCSNTIVYAPLSNRFAPCPWA
jgi:hypothetical protein